MKKYLIFTAILAFFLVCLFTYFVYQNNKAQQAADQKEPETVTLEDGTVIKTDGSTVIEKVVEDAGLPDEPLIVFYVDGVRHEAYEMTPELQAIIDGLDASDKTREGGFQIVDDETEIVAGLTVGAVRTRLNNSSILAEGILKSSDGTEMGTAKVGVDADYVLVGTRSPLPTLVIPEGENVNVPSYNVWLYANIPSENIDAYMNLGPMWEQGPEDYEFLTTMDKQASSLGIKAMIITKEDTLNESDTPDESRIVARVDF